MWDCHQARLSSSETVIKEADIKEADINWECHQVELSSSGAVIKWSCHQVELSSSGAVIIETVIAKAVIRRGCHQGG